MRKTVETLRTSGYGEGVRDWYKDLPDSTPLTSRLVWERTKGDILTRLREVDRLSLGEKDRVRLGRAMAKEIISKISLPEGNLSDIIEGSLLDEIDETPMYLALWSLYHGKRGANIVGIAHEVLKRSGEEGLIQILGEELEIKA